MVAGKYFFNGKDITMNICIQVRDVIRIIMDRTGMVFPDTSVSGLFFVSNFLYRCLSVF